MIEIAPAAIQIPAMRNEFGILAHGNVYAIDYRADARAREAAKAEAAVEVVPTEAEVIAKVEKGQELTPAERKVLNDRPLFAIFRQVRLGWVPVETVKGEVMLGRKIAHLIKNAKPGQTSRYRAKTTGGEWIYF